MTNTLETTTSGKTWRLSRAGIINFWFYDHQEFKFGDGRMLLRGANGSGKSVTMQSFIPLLLDGNRSPERLDPFGSTSRRLDTYMLSEEDSRDERTGYLYLELYHEPTGVSKTIGMGIQARKNKPLNVWYFCLDSYWTVGENFSFYTSSQKTRVLSRVELRDAVGEYGLVFERQGEYMEEVNRRFFGFDSVQTYKELLNLLIQLRSPKLSKDFKPTVISEILSDSLEPLSDDDFRPLSQSIEHMDSTEARLTHIKGVKEATSRLSTAFNAYNSAFFQEKSNQLKEHLIEQVKLEEKITKFEKQINEGQENLIDLREKLEVLNQERVFLEAKKEAAEEDDLIELMEKELKLREENKKLENQIQRKTSEITRKEANIRAGKDRLRKEEDELGKIKLEINADLDELDEFAQLLDYKEHELFKKEFDKNKEIEYNFALAKRDQDKYYQDLRNAYQAVYETKQAQNSYDHYQALYDGERSSYQKTENQINRWENELDRLKTEWKGTFRSWQEECRALLLSDELILGLEASVEKIENSSDITAIQGRFAEVRNDYSLKYQREQSELKHKLEIQEEAKEEAKEKLKELEERGYVEPITSSNNKASRKILNELNISYEPLYLALELSKSYSEELVTNFEQVLFELGLLNTIVVSDKYKDRVLQSASQLSDNFIFVDETDWSNLLNSLKQETNDPEGSLRTFLKKLLTLTEADLKVDLEKRMYQLGNLTGFANISYPEAYLNASRRKAYFEKQLYEVREEVKKLEDLCSELTDQIRLLNQAITGVDLEFSKVPDFSDIQVALNELESLANQLKAVSDRMKEVEKTLSEERAKYDKAHSKSRALTKNLSLEHSLEIVEEALSLCQDYGTTLEKLSQRHKSFLTLLRSYEIQQENLENDEYDLTILIGEKNSFLRELEQSTKELEGLSERLKQEDSKELLAQLEDITKRLSKLPEEEKELTSFEIKQATSLEYLEKDLTQAKDQQKAAKALLDSYFSAYLEELDLAYVYEDKSLAKDYKTRLISFVEAEEPNWGKALSLVEDELEELSKSKRYTQTTSTLEHYSNRLANSYYEQRQELTDYGVVMLSYTTKARINEEPLWQRPEIKARVDNRQVDLYELEEYFNTSIESLSALVEKQDRELFEEIITDTISKKIRAKIFRSELWVEQMNKLMADAGKETTSGFALSLRWVYKDSQQEGELSSRELIELLKMSAELMKDSDRDKLTQHFRRKINQARQKQVEEGNSYSFHAMIKEVLDYRKWFEFQLRFKKKGEQFRELTNNRFFALSGGEKAMAMYVPLFSAVVAKYNGAEADAPRIISLDEAFAGIDEQNIREMFRYMVTFDFNFIINSQILWGDYDTVPKMNIYQLVRPNNEPYVTVIPHVWNGSIRVPVLEEPIQDSLAY